MDYKKLHEEAIEKAQRLVYEGKITEEIAKQIISDFSPIDDEEWTRRWLIGYFEKVNDEIIEEDRKKIITWLEKQKQQNWWRDEDDKIMLGLVAQLEIIGASTRTDVTSVNYTFAREIEWLKALRHKKIAMIDGELWKPSKQQMEAIRGALNLEKVMNKAIDPYLISVYQDLEKLF